MSRRVVNFHSSVGGAAFVEALLEEWRGLGWQVELINSLTEDDYRRPRSTLGRLGLRWQMYAGQAGLNLAAARGLGEGIHVVTTNPFFAPLLVQRAATPAAATINLVYDLFPDALEQAGRLREGSLLSRGLAGITRRALAECTVSVFLGERMRAHAEARYGAARRAVVIAVGADGAPFRKISPIATDSAHPVRVLYSGQMGRMHDFATLGDALERGLPDRLQLRFQATGAGYANLRARLINHDRVIWGGALGHDDWLEAMKSAEVSLVSLSPGAQRVAMPSKTYSSLVAGHAIVAICPRDSDLADLVAEHDCGWLVEPGDEAGLRGVFEEIATDRAMLLRKRLNAWRCGHERFDMSVIAREWDGIFRALSKGSG